MRIRSLRQHLRLLKKWQQADKRYPHHLHPEEENLNLFFYNISQMTPAACQRLLAHNTQIDFICALNEDMTIGIELPYKQIEKFRQTHDAKENQTADLLENLLGDLIIKHYPSIADQITQHLAQHKKEIDYTEKDLKELIHDFIVKENKEDIQHKNAPLLNLLLKDRAVRKIIKSQFQNGHPSILPASHRVARIGGDLRYQNGVWIIRNKSGRFGQKHGNKRRALLFHAVHLLKMESILKKQGIAASAEIFFKPDQMPSYMHLLYELANEALDNFRKTNKVYLSMESLNRIPNSHDKYLFVLGLQHIQNHVDSFNTEAQPQNDPMPHALQPLFPEFKLENLPAYEKHRKQNRPIVNHASHPQMKSFYKHNHR